MWRFVSSLRRGSSLRYVVTWRRVFSKDPAASFLRVTVTVDAKAGGPLATLATIYQTTRRRIPKDGNDYSHRHDSLIYLTSYLTAYRFSISESGRFLRMFWRILSVSRL